MDLLLETVDEFLKDGDRDITSSSVVFCRSKGGEAIDRALLEELTIVYNIARSGITIYKSIRLCPFAVKGDYTVMSCSLHSRLARLRVFSQKFHLRSDGICCETSRGRVSCIRKGMRPLIDRHWQDTIRKDSGYREN